MRRLLALAALPFVVVAFIAIAWLDDEVEAVECDSGAPYPRGCEAWTCGGRC